MKIPQEYCQELGRGTTRAVMGVGAATESVLREEGILTVDQLIDEMNYLLEQHNEESAFAEFKELIKKRLRTNNQWIQAFWDDLKRLRSERTNQDEQIIQEFDQRILDLPMAAVLDVEGETADSLYQMIGIETVRQMVDIIETNCNEDFGTDILISQYDLFWQRVEVVNITDSQAMEAFSRIICIVWWKELRISPGYQFVEVGQFKLEISTLAEKLKTARLADKKNYPGADEDQERALSRLEKNPTHKQLNEKPDEEDVEVETTTQSSEDGVPKQDDQIVPIAEDGQSGHYSADNQHEAPSKEEPKLKHLEAQSEQIGDQLKALRLEEDPKQDHHVVISTVQAEQPDLNAVSAKEKTSLCDEPKQDEQEKQPGQVVADDQPKNPEEKKELKQEPQTKLPGGPEIEVDVLNEQLRRHLNDSQKNASHCPHGCPFDG